MAEKTSKKKSVKRGIKISAVSNKTVKKLSAGSDLLEKYKTHKTDTGSTEVQIVLLTKNITELTKHLKNHKHDFDSRTGLLKIGRAHV